jgi:hypothetical protein
MDKTGFDPLSPLIDSETQILITTQQKLLDQGVFLLDENLRPDVRQYLVRKIVTGQRDLQRALYAMSNIEGKNRIFDRTAHRNIQLDIQEIIEELNNDYYDRETYELQQSIFDRLQEQQFAFLTPEESGERSRIINRSESSETGTITFPDTALEPVQKKDLITAALEASLSAGYPPEYEEMIRNYFTLLIEAESDAIVNPNNQLRPSGDDQFNNHRNRN